MEIKVEYKNIVLGNGLFWKGPAERISDIRNVVARNLANKVSTDGITRTDGMWTVSVEVPMDINEMDDDSIGWTELAELRRKADQWDALGYTSPHVMPEDYEQVKRDAEKWRRLMALFDTSCDKCFLGHVCGTHGRPEAVCEDIKDVMSEVKDA